MQKKEKAELLEKYPRKGNCRVEAPMVNEEIEGIINEKMKRRDRYFVLDQNVCGSGLLALGTAISMILTEDEEGIEKFKLLKLLNDAGWLFSKLFHLLTLARESFLFASIDRKIKAILEKCKVDEWLFSAELAEKIRAVKAAKKVGSTLKCQPIQPRALVGRFQGNWKSPLARRSQQGQL